MADGNEALGQGCSCDGCEATPVIRVDLKALVEPDYGCVIEACLEHVEAAVEDALRATLVINRLVEPETADELDVRARAEEHLAEAPRVKVKCVGGPLDGELLEEPAAMARLRDRAIPAGATTGPETTVMLRPMGHDGQYVATFGELDDDGNLLGKWVEDA